MKKRFIFLWILIGLGTTIASIAFSQTFPSPRAMNPNIGANFLFEGQKTNSNSADGFHLPESEFSFKSDIDPYFTANMIFSVAETNSGNYEISPEEVYADTISIPGVTFRIGKFYSFFGKQNRLHTHAFPFLDRPLISTALFDDGLNAAGLQASVLLPTNFFSELTVEGMQNFKTLAHLRTLFELGDFSTLELGASGVTHWAYGLDVTFKFRPTDRGQGRRINLSGEWMSGQVEGFTPQPDPSGLPTQGFDLYGQYEFLQQTYVQYRFDDLISSSTTRHGFLVGYAPSEFSVVRLQADRTFASGLTPENRVMAQLNFTIGFHPAHDY
jgi:hypothetical protein